MWKLEIVKKISYMLQAMVERVSDMPPAVVEREAIS